MPNPQQPAKMWSGRFREPLNRTFEQWQPSFHWYLVLIAIFAKPPISASAQPMMSSNQVTKCSQPTMNRLEKESEHIRSWFELQGFYNRYSACGTDDAEVSTGVSESVVRMLINDWDSLATASRLFSADQKFKSFALAGLNITDATEDLSRIDKLATDHCAPNLHSLCRDIRKSIRNNN